MRVAKDAFGTNLPERDLYLSPGHAVCVNCVDEVLIPVGELVNGATIVRVKIDDVTYWHVELDAHDILFANGLPAESYLDVGNRSFFSGETSAPDADRALQTVERYCRPFSIDRVIVEAIRSRLRTQALRLGWRIADIDADVRLEVDGSVVLPRLADGVARFVVPADARDVWLVSKTFVPRGLDISADPRTLGVRLIGIGIDDGLGHRAEVSMDDSRFCLGFHAPEWEGETALRWTAGRCKLPASVWSGCEGEFFLKLQLASTAITSWTAPDETQGDDELSTGSRLRPHLIEALAA